MFCFNEIHKKNPKILLQIVHILEFQLKISAKHVYYNKIS